MQVIGEKTAPKGWRTRKECFSLESIPESLKCLIQCPFTGQPSEEKLREYKKYLEDTVYANIQLTYAMAELNDMIYVVKCDAANCHGAVLAQIVEACSQHIQDYKASHTAAAMRQEEYEARLETIRDTHRAEEQAVADLCKTAQKHLHKITVPGDAEETYRRWKLYRKRYLNPILRYPTTPV